MPKIHSFEHFTSNLFKRIKKNYEFSKLPDKYCGELKNLVIWRHIQNQLDSQTRQCNVKSDRRDFPYYFSILNVIVQEIDDN